MAFQSSTFHGVSQQWAQRPADERFVSIPEMIEMKRKVQDITYAKVLPTKVLDVIPHPADPAQGLLIQGQNGKPSQFTNWAFGQLCGLVGAPAGYLRDQPAKLAAVNLTWGIQQKRKSEELGVLVTRGPQDEVGEFRAATGPNYGRIWDLDVLQWMYNRFGDGVTGDFRVPGEFGKAVTVDRDNTTLYASDRDMYVFLADEVNRVEIDNRRDGKGGSLARGFVVWNSEVGSKTFGIAMFLFDYACCNRILWGVKAQKEITLRHTKSAPGRMGDEIMPMLLEYSKASASPIEAALAAAQQKKIDDVDKLLSSRLSSKSLMAMVKKAHMEEEGRPIETLWDATTAVTAYAKRIPHQDDRVEMEKIGGSFIDLAL